MGSRNLPGSPKGEPIPAPISLRPGTKSQPRGLAERERGVEVLLGVVPEVRKPDCRHSCSGATLTKPWGWPGWWKRLSRRDPEAEVVSRGLLCLQIGRLGCAPAHRPPSQGGTRLRRLAKQLPPYRGLISLLSSPGKGFCAGAMWRFWLHLRGSVRGGGGQRAHQLPAVGPTLAGVVPTWTRLAMSLSESSAASQCPHLIIGPEHPFSRLSPNSRH